MAMNPIGISIVNNWHRQQGKGKVDLYSA